MSDLKSGRWSREDHETMVQMHSQGKSYKEIGAAVQRTAEQVGARCYQFGMKRKHNMMAERIVQNRLPNAVNRRCQSCLSIFETDQISKTLCDLCFPVGINRALP